jgi:hypothetical protein
VVGWCHTVPREPAVIYREGGGVGPKEDGVGGVGENYDLLHDNCHKVLTDVSLWAECNFVPWKF